MDEFITYVTEDLLGELGGVRARKMFGGWGIYDAGGVFFAIVIDNELYLKVDDENRPLFEAIGSRPFSYKKQSGQVYAMSYWLVPGELFEEREKFLLLAQSAREAGQRAKRPKPSKRSKVFPKQ